MGRKIIQAIALCLLIASCNKGDGDKPVMPPSFSGPKAFIICEGSLGNGSSALSLYQPNKDSVYEDVYKAVNAQSIGDIFQSMVHIGDDYLLCVNNSDKLLRIGYNDLLLEGSLGIPKPRYILPVSATKAYVSSLFSNQLYVINPQSFSITDTIQLPFQNAEGMVLQGNTAYICTWDTSAQTLLSINTITDQLNTPIPLGGYAPQEALLDKEQKLWVLSGNVPKGKSAALTRIDPATRQVLKTYSFAAAADPIRPVLNATKDTLYFIEVNYNGGTANNGIYRMSIQDAALPTQPFIAAQGFQYFWALGIAPGSGYIYVGDPVGFTQRGTVSVYRPDGVLVKNFRVGIGPGHFLFDE